MDKSLIFSAPNQMDVIWTQKKKGLCCSLEFPDFRTAMNFMLEAAGAAEKSNHHPDWRNVYRRVEICLNTHDAGNRVTEKDHALSAEITRILLSYQFTNS